MLGRNHGDVHPHLSEHGWNVISGAHDVSDFQVVENLHIYDADALPRRLVVVETAEIFACDQRVPFAVFLTFRFEDGANCSAALLLQPGGKNFELDFLLFSAMRETNRRLRGLRALTIRQF
jgi:hypothetical protein